MRLRHLVYVLPAALVLLFAACGGDDSGGSSSGTGTDDTYVAQICSATIKFSDAIKKVNPADVQSADAAAKAITAPLNDYVTSISQANPPKDIKPYHDQIVKAFQDAQAKLKTDPNALQGFTPPKAPQAIEDRLTKAATSNKDCVAAGFTFGN